jgi:NADH-quinone oxidoreductase subunit J
MRVEMFVFLVAAAICIASSLGVVLFRNPVHNALSLVATLFGVAVLFVAQGAYFLAAIQVIVYAGAIVVLFLFVIMLLGVDRADDVKFEPIPGIRIAAIVVGIALLGMTLMALLGAEDVATGTPSTLAPLDPGVPDINRIGAALFTDYIYAFELTAALLTIAVVGAVMLSRKSASDAIDREEFPDDTMANRLAERREAKLATVGAPEPVSEESASEEAASEGSTPGSGESDAADDGNEGETAADASSDSEAGTTVNGEDD